MKTEAQIARRKRYIAGKRLRDQQKYIETKNIENHKKKLHHMSYLSAQAAIDHLAQVNDSGDNTERTIYTCPICGQWLVGKQSYARIAVELAQEENNV